jgi:3-phenylpropionate/trans-cinnamate dioxygenase ferredoxin reductase subunit
VLATGGRPRRLSLADRCADSASNVHYLRTIDHAYQLREGFQPDRRLVILGGGYIGLEVAAVACQKKMHVTLLECLPRVLARVTAPQVSDFYTGVHRAAGVNILVNTQLTGFICGSTGRVTAAETSGLSLPADRVLVGIGLIPNTELAEEAGLEIDNGIAVDEYGQTSDPDILAIGDCSSRPNSHVGRRVRLESVPSTVEQARTAAAVLVGKRVAYDTLPWFWSDQYNLKLQIAGLNEGYDSVVLRGSPDTESFLAFYLKDRMLLAVDAVNRVRDFSISKKLVAARIEIDPDYLVDDSQPLADLLNAR